MQSVKFRLLPSAVRPTEAILESPIYSYRLRSISGASLIGLLHQNPGSAEGWHSHDAVYFPTTGNGGSRLSRVTNLAPSCRSNLSCSRTNTIPTKLKLALFVDRWQHAPT